MEQVIGKRLKVKTRAASVYDVDASQADIFRKNIQPLPLEEVRAKDRVEVSGDVFSDNSLLAKTVVDRSVYPRRTTLTGKVEVVTSKGFTLYTALFGLVEVLTDTLTSFVGLLQNTLVVGLKVRVKGLWERPQGEVHALVVESRTRKVKIEFTGELVMRSPEHLTVVADGVIYGVDIRNAKLVLGRKKVGVLDLPMGGKLKVSGKHLPEDVAVEAVEVRVGK